MNIFKMKDNEPIKYEKEYWHEKEGYKAIVYIDKISDGFNSGAWQNGDPLGSIKIKGPNVDYHLKENQRPFSSTKTKLNLAHGRDVVVELGKKLKEKYNTEVDYKELHDLFELPFQNFYDDFYNSGVKTKLPKGFGSGGRRY